MKQLFGLIKFEYKKMFSRKITLITMILTLIAIIIMTIGTVNSHDTYHNGSSNILSIKKDVETIRQNKGYIDDNFIKNALDKNKKLISKDSNFLINDYGKFVTTDAYIKYTLPYENFNYIANIIYEKNDENLSTDGNIYFNMSSNMPINSIDKLSAKDFYTNLEDSIKNNVNGDTLLSYGEKKEHMNMLSKIKKPYYNDSHFAYTKFLNLDKDLGLIILVAIAICVAPVFANEYTNKTDQIILSSKYGKSKIIKAKLFTSITFSIIYSFIVFSVLLLILQVIFGFCGASCPIQLYHIYCSYNITMFEACAISIVVAVVISVMFSVITCFLSAKCNSPFTVIIIDFIIILLPLFLTGIRNNRLLVDLIRIFPTKAISDENLFGSLMFGTGSVVIKPYIFYILITVIFAVALRPLTFKSFKEHKI